MGYFDVSGVSDDDGRVGAVAVHGFGFVGGVGVFL